MNLGVTEVLADIRQEDMHLFGFPAQQVGKQAHRESFQAVLELDEIPGSHGFLIFSSVISVA